MSKSITICSIKNEGALKFKKPVGSKGNIIKDDLLLMEDHELSITLKRLKEHKALLAKAGFENTYTLGQIKIDKKIIPSFGPIFFF